MSKPLNVIFLGLSGSGKGTQVEMLKQRLLDRQKTYVSSTGALLRELKDADTAAGHRLKKILEDGGLVPSIVAVSAWLHAISWNVKDDEGIFFEGSPRKVWEAEIMDEFLHFLERDQHTQVIYIFLSPEEAIERLKKRGREDDTEEAIRARIAFFHKDVAPVVEHYRARGNLVEINGDQSMEDVHKDIVAALGL